jgi:hypothetical protein
MAGAGVAGRPTTPCLGLLPGPFMPPSDCRMNKPMLPNFFFVVGIILNRIDTVSKMARKLGKE